MPELDAKPKKWGCYHYLAIAAIIFSLLAYIAWSCIFRSVPLRISKETTYITEPLDATGKYVDYFHARELALYPPEMKTDDNGVRIMTRALGISQTETMSPEYTKSYYEKLGLDPAVTPTHFFLEPTEYIMRMETLKPEVYDTFKRPMYEIYLKEFAKGEEDRKNNPALRMRTEMGMWLDETPFALPDLTDEETEVHFPYEPQEPDEYASWRFDTTGIDALFSVPWTVEEYPIMEHWLHDCSPALDVIAEAVQKPAFTFPWVRTQDNASFTLFTMATSSLQAVRPYYRGLKARANHRLAQRDFDGVYDDTITCSRLGRRVGHYGFLFTSLVGFAGEQIANEVDVVSPGEKQPTAVQLKRLLDEYDRLPPRVDIEILFESERFMILETSLSIMSSPEKLTDFTNAWTGNLVSISGVDWNTVFKHINKTCDEFYSGKIDYEAHMRILYSPPPLKLLTLESRSEIFAIIIETLFLPTPDVTKGAFPRSECSDNLRRLVLAMLIYEKEHGTLPPTFTVDANGNPLHSWRTFLLPYLGDDAKQLYEQIKLDEPWDSEHNKQFHDANLAVFQCPSANKALKVEGGTHYRVIVGNNTAFGLDGKGRASKAFKKNMLLIVESKDAICWMRPNEEIAQAEAEILFDNRTPTKISSHHAGGINAAMKGGGVRFISQTISMDLWKNLVTGTDEVVP